MTAKPKPMTVNRLIEILTDLKKSGYGKLRVCVDKASFHHNCEADGCVILDVSEIRVVRVLKWDNDNDGIKINKDGTEASSRKVVIYGNDRVW